jgi:hypothetical protein
VPSATFSGTVTAAVGGAPLAGATVELLGTPIVLTTDASGNCSHPAVPEGHYTVEVKAFGWGRLRAPLTVTAGVPQQLDAEMAAAFTAQSFESGAPGWGVGFGTNSGKWALGDPQGTLGGTFQPEDDHSVPGVIAWVTDPVAGPAVDSGDVDGGATVLTSPIFSIASLPEAHVSYWRWYQTGLPGNASTDFFVVEVSSAGGPWIVLEATDQGRAEWVERDFRIADYVTPGNLMRFRFTAQDTGAASVTEAALDDFQIYVPATSVPTAAADLPAAADPGVAPALGPGVPNPVRAGDPVRLVLRLPRGADVEAAVHDVSGRRVVRLLRGRLAAGAHPLTWDGRAESGGAAASGTYVVRVRADGRVLARKVLVLR